jgi:hypothetical protein
LHLTVGREQTMEKSFQSDAFEIGRFVCLRDLHFSQKKRRPRRFMNVSERLETFFELYTKIAGAPTRWGRRLNEVSDTKLDFISEKAHFLK